MPVTLTCKRCGKEFTDTPSRASGRKYCSRPCLHLGQRKRVIFPCEVCGKDVIVTRSKAEDGRRTCSVECGDESRRRTMTGRSGTYFR